MPQKIRLWRLLLKTALLLLLFNFGMAAIDSNIGNRISIYNSLVPGRARLPFGENSKQSYNLSLFDIDTMFASHIITNAPKPDNEYRVIIIGDSSVWGTLLRPEETLTGQLNALGLKTDNGQSVRVYNIGYPSMSLTKDLILLEQAMNYEPDLVIWMLTLESFPADRQLAAPLAAHNPEHVRKIADHYDLNLGQNNDALIKPTLWDKTLIGRRQPLADWYRLQIYGVMWGITGIDQYYPEAYQPAQRDFETNLLFHDWAPPELPINQMAFEIIEAGFRVTGATPLILINEPIFISNGKNSNIRYNYFYPRWAYDQYRILLAERSAQNNWVYVDCWNIIPIKEFTNSSVHLTPIGENILSRQISAVILKKTVSKCISIRSGKIIH